MKTFLLAICFLFFAPLVLAQDTQVVPPVEKPVCHTIEGFKKYMVPSLEILYGPGELTSVIPKQVPNALIAYNDLPPRSSFIADEIQIVTHQDNPDMNFVFLFKDGCFVDGEPVNEAGLRHIIGSEM